MKVTIKDFDVEMEIKNNGIELEVRDPSGQRQLGDLILTKTQVIWCPGRTQRKNGRKLTWERFIEVVNNTE
jgi:hypothetical protein